MQASGQKAGAFESEIRAKTSKVNPNNKERIEGCAFFVVKNRKGEKMYYKVNQATKLMGMGRTRLLEEIRAGNISALTYHSAYVIHVKEIARYLTSRGRTPPIQILKELQEIQDFDKKADSDILLSSTLKSENNNFPLVTVNGKKMKNDLKNKERRGNPYQVERLTIKSQ